MELIFYYREARDQLAKHGPALDYALAKFRRLHPDLRASKTELERSLAEFQPRGAGEVLIPQVDPIDNAQMEELAKLHNAAKATLNAYGFDVPELCLTRNLKVCKMRIGARPTFRVNGRSS